MNANIMCPCFRIETPLTRRYSIRYMIQSEIWIKMNGLLWRVLLSCAEQHDGMRKGGRDIAGPITFCGRRAYSTCVLLDDTSLVSARPGVRGSIRSNSDCVGSARTIYASEEMTWLASTLLTDASSVLKTGFGFSHQHIQSLARPASPAPKINFFLT